MSLSRNPLLSILIVLPLLSAVALSAEEKAQPVSRAELADKVRLAILRLPYYGVFDLLSFEVKGDSVVLGGAAYRPGLKTDAENTVKSLPGVSEVVDRIQVLPTSFEDDRLRYGVFWRIYTDSFLSKYGTPVGGVRLVGRRMWGHRYGSWAGFARGPWGRAPFLGMEPLGDYAIHIIVEHGNVTLYGVVDNQADKTKAVLEARQVLGVRSVDDQLQVASD